MLGWCPRPSLQNRPSSDRHPKSHEIVHFSAFENEKPVLQPPHQVVIGFDLGSDNSRSLHTQACESPRSVLEPHRPQSGSPRSPLSGLGSLLSGRVCAVSANTESEELSTEVHAFHTPLKRGHTTCRADRVHPYNAPDAAVHARREGRAYPCFSTMLSSDDEEDSEETDIDISESIFSAASPVSHHSTFSNDQAVDFLSKCFQCGRLLADGKDIFMYRGDQAFCSQECRYKQIAADERKHRSPVAAIHYFSTVNSNHRSVARATQAALA